MKDKELQKLEKEELIELLLEQNEQVDHLQKKIDRKTYKKKYVRKLRSTISILVVVAALAVLAATIFLPVLQIYGKSMTPTVSAGDMVVSLKKSNCKKGDIIAFYYNNKILVKRVIATSGEWINIDEEGNVTIDGNPLDEPYVKRKALGKCDIKLPYQVPEGKIFVMGDHRSVSIDSRKSSIGCVGKDQIVGKLIFRVWPLKKAGIIQ